MSEYQVMKTCFEELTITTGPGSNLHTITRLVEKAISSSGISEGIVAVTSQHTTTAITLNEDEERLHSDMENHFEKLAPANLPYLHNDIHLRDCYPDKPENAHSHLIAMLIGSSESTAVRQGRSQLGKWQPLLLAEMDGPRRRHVSVQIIGE